MFWENIYILIKGQTFTSRILKKVDLTLKNYYKKMSPTLFLTFKQSDPFFVQKSKRNNTR